MSEGYVLYDSTGRNVVGGGTRYRRRKDLKAQIQQQKQKPVVNLVTPVSQWLERANSELLLRTEETQEDATNGGYKLDIERRNKNRAHGSQPMDSNVLRYKIMNNYQLADILRGYSVAIGTADAIRPHSQTFVISNTNTSKGPGKHLVVFYFPK